ncbi:MAG TPA: FHA domain-containing protein [Microbacteriaceae bacterium]|nr:FHA domain-containing protein [Microbacteriaceae bacterium]
MDDQLTPTPHPGESRPTTTHAAWGAGHPRLLISRGDERRIHEFAAATTTIGSGPDVGLHLPGTDIIHATITHDARDEFVLTLHGEGEMNSNPEADGNATGDRTETLRTGARFTMGDWTLVYQRDEFADHGRPYGGRQGGEFSDQPQQPPRPDYPAAAHS